jgi:hypothetical protein
MVSAVTILLNCQHIPRQTTIIQTVFAVELDHQAFLKIVRALSHDLGVRILEDMSTPDLHMALSGQDPQSGLGSEVDQFPSEVTLVLRHVLVER